MACTWPVSYSACATDAESGDPTCFDNATDQALFEDLATSILSNWTDAQFGLCTDVVRPCRSNCTSRTWPLYLGSPLFLCQQCGTGACGCTTTPSVGLPGRVDSIDDVLLDGVSMDPTLYRVDDWKWLVRLDGEGWPLCQSMDLPPTETGTWVVSYVRGRPVPVGGQVAAGILACELAKAACNDSTCQLPKRMQNITRQGVSVTLLDDFASLQQGQTGIWLIDAWLASVNRPGGPSTVMSPDTIGKVRRTTWAYTPPGP